MRAHPSIVSAVHGMPVPCILEVAVYGKNVSMCMMHVGMRQWTHLEQQSFPMSEPEYMEKLNNIAFYLGCASMRCPARPLRHGAV